MTVRAAWLQPTGQTREDTRAVPVGTMTPMGELTSRSGVIPGGNPFTATGTAAMQVQIGTGRAVIQGTTAQGAYPVAATAPETLTIGDGNAQFARIDSVIARVYDGMYDTEGQTLATIEIVQGEASATPTAPTLPAASLRLWDITVPAGTSAGTGGINWATALADRRLYTVAVGGITPGQPYGRYAGQWRDNAGVLERYSGTDWEPVIRLGNAGQLQLGDARLYRSTTNTLKTDSSLVVKTHKAYAGEVGRASVTFSSTTSHTRTITFATPFAAPPIVFVNINSTAGQTNQWHVRAYNISASAFTLWCFRDTAGAWSAVEVGWAAFATP